MSPRRAGVSRQSRLSSVTPRHVRALIPGGTFFFTVALLERRRLLLTGIYAADWGASDEVRGLDME